jgi:cytoskeletal protein CcmA (bactofilin family)
MFGGNNKKESNTGRSTSAPTANGFNSLVKGTVVEGTVTSESDIRIDGTIKGKLHCDAKVIIGPTGRVEGEIRCQNAVIEGSFEGVLQVKELLNIREAAKIGGEVTTEKLIVQSGAAFNVTCTMGGSAPRQPANGSPSNKTAQEKKDTSSVKANKAAGA